MGKVPHFMLSTLLLLVFVASCTNKKGNDKKHVTKKVDLEIPVNKDIASDTKPQLQTNTEDVIGTAFNYDLSKPVQTSILGSDLLEISALSFDAEDNLL